MGRARDLIIECINEKHTSQRQLAARMDTRVQYINQQLNGDDMKFLKVIEMLDYLGYEVSIMNIEGIRRVRVDEINHMEDLNCSENKVWASDGNKYITAIKTDSGWKPGPIFENKPDCLDYLMKS